MGAIRISLRTPVAITVDDNGAAAPEPSSLVGLVLWEGDLAQELPDDLFARGVSAGPLRLVAESANAGLMAVIDFTFRTAPSAATLDRLLQFVHEQYIDGLGEGGFEIAVPPDTVRIELVLDADHRRSFDVERQDVPASTPKRSSPLLKAAEKGDEAKVRKLIAKGEPVDATGKYRVTPLILAAQKHHAGVVAILLEAGADANQASEAGTAPLLHAVMANTPLPIIEQLVAGGADVRGRNTQGYSPVAMAANRGAHATLAFLLGVGGDANTPDERGNTPLMLAQPRGNFRILELLLAHGADPALRNAEGRDAVAEALNQADGFARGDHHGFHTDRVEGERRKATFLQATMAAASKR